MLRTLLASLLAAVSLPAFAAPLQDPRTAGSTTRLIPFTAALPSAEGEPAAAGPRSITFALYDEAEGGTLLWSETQVIDTDARGRYAAYLGASQPLPLEIFRTEQARWLQVSVNGRDLPRTMLVAVPYALRAADAETLGGRTLSDFVLADSEGRRVRADGTSIDVPSVDGGGVAGQLTKWTDADTLSSSIITESLDNRLGILAPDPTGGGVVDSRVTIRNPDNNTAFGVLSPFNQRRFALNTNLTGSWTLYDGFGGNWNQGIVQSNGRIGIGTTSPGTPLHVNGSSIAARFNTSSGNNAVMSTGPDGTTTLVGTVDDCTNCTWIVPGGAGVLGYNTLDGHGVVGQADGTGRGVAGFSDTGPAIYGNPLGTGLAGQFVGDVTVTGTLMKGGGAFQIDHPLDPANKYLRHSFVESPDMMNVYNGNATLDANGEASVTLPGWFEALNGDFRYQLTAIGAPGPNLHIASEIADNQFRIAGGSPGARVSWLVTGIRHDPWANAHRIVIEEPKPAGEQGFYLQPEAQGLSRGMALPSVRHEGVRIVRDK